MSDLFSMIMKIKHIKGIAIGITISVVFLLIIFPIMSVFFEDSVTSEIIGNYGVVGIPISEGGNDYREIKEGSEEEKALIEYLEQSGLWNTSIAKSREAQVSWYRKLSKMLEETYIDGEPSKNTIDAWGYRTNSSCPRATKGDYANEECNTNGKVKYDRNYLYFEWESDGSKVKKTTCTDYEKGETPIYSLKSATKNFYTSNEVTHIPGGKIVGLYPDILVAAAIGNTYSTFDQNRVESMEEIDSNSQAAAMEQMQKVLGAFGVFSSIINNIRNTIKLWLDYATVIASSNDALKDTFAEGSLYSTFHFYPESSCTVTDVVAYENGPDEFPKGKDEDGNETPYICSRWFEGYTKCAQKTITDKEHCGEDKNGNAKTCTVSYADELEKVDGNINTYYWTRSKEHNEEVSKTIPDKNKQFYDGVGPVTLEENTGKYCEYLREGSKDKGKIYQVSVKWVCIPNKPKETDPQITCEVSPVKDKLGRILYYECASISESEVREKIVDPILDAYESNQTDKVKNQYMTTETANKYINGFDESKYDLSSINPNGYKIDEETRKIVTKHIVNEILGLTEGRRAAIATKEGYFYLNSYNRVLNKDQYKDALLSTLFVKDDLILKAGKDVNFAEKLGLKDEKDLNNRKYSQKLYGVFYSEYNSDFDDWSSEKIEQQMKEDKSRKNSLIMEIFETYDYISKYLSEEGSISSGTSGSGLAQADSSGFRQRTFPPAYSGYWTNGYYGECPWYARGRVKEILANAGSNYNWTYTGNGGDWCSSSNTDKDNFVISRNYLAPKPGSIVSWRDTTGSYGHVAIVEEVTPTTVTISESFISLGIYGSNARNMIYKDGYNHGTAAANCSRNGCWQRRTLTYDQMKNAGWTNYKFECYIYLLKDDNNNNNDDNKVNENQTDTRDIAAYIVNEFKKGDGIEAKVNFYNWVSETEGGAKLNINMISDSYLSENVKVTNTKEGNNAASIDPGLYIGTLDSTLNIDINGKSYSYKLCNGCTVPRWVGLYKYIESYNSHRTTVLNLISSAGLSSQLSTIPKIHTFMRMTWTYGPSGAKDKINQMLNAYKKGGNHDMWCSLSKNVLGTIDGEINIIGNYFNINEMIFTLFTTGIYISNPNYKNYSYYTISLVEKLLNSGYERYGTNALEVALTNGNILSNNSYSDCVDYSG